MSPDLYCLRKTVPRTMRSTVRVIASAVADERRCRRFGGPGVLVAGRVNVYKTLAYLHSWRMELKSKGRPVVGSPFFCCSGRLLRDVQFAANPSGADVFLSADVERWNFAGGSGSVSGTALQV